VFPQLVVQRGLNTGLMVASGTSFSAPVVSGTVALILQKNPGLTPPMVKAILQYTAEALPNQNLMQQGAGLVNVLGALQLSDALATNISSRIAAGTITPGDSILTTGKSMPAPTSIIQGR
jgi:subtilisin family serine protease